MKTFKKQLTKVQMICYIILAPKKGSLAQLGEHLPYKQRVIGSSPITPTILWFENCHTLDIVRGFFLFSKNWEKIWEFLLKIAEI